MTFARESILKIRKKRISVLLFLVLVQQIRVLDTKKLEITYSLNLGENF